MSQHRDKKSDFLNQRAPIIIVIGLLVSGFFIASLLREIGNRQKIEHEIDKLTDDIDRMDNVNRELDRFVSSWENSSQLEREARTKLGLKKSGEQVVVINRGGTVAGDSNLISPGGRIIGSSIDQLDQISNINKWWKYFFN